MTKLYTVEDRIQEQEINWKQVKLVASMEQNVFAPPLTNGILYKGNFGGKFDVINLTVDTSNLSWSPPPIRRPAFQERITYFIIIFLLILFLLLRHCLARWYLGRQQLAATPVWSMEPVCCICEGKLFSICMMLTPCCVPIALPTNLMNIGWTTDYPRWRKRHP